MLVDGCSRQPESPCSITNLLLRGYLILKHTADAFRCGWTGRTRDLGCVRSVWLWCSRKGGCEHTGNVPPHRGDDRPNCSVWASGYWSGDQEVGYNREKTPLEHVCVARYNVTLFYDDRAMKDSPLWSSIHFLHLALLPLPILLQLPTSTSTTTTAAAYHPHTTHNERLRLRLPTVLGAGKRS